MSVFAVAIDFGTTYSGYAFSVSHPVTRLRNVQILSNQAWNSGIQETISLKTPTCLLLTKDKEIVAFGYEAENQYTDIAMDEAEDDYYFFDRFKMYLHNNKNITMGMVIEDVRGQPLPAVEVFSLAIKAIKDHLKQTVEVKNIHLDLDTQWIITVPAIWTDTAKRFMRKAAEMAGILDDKLTLALEPEAASIYCQTFPSAGSTNIITVSSKYLVVDLGGGTIDITAHEKLPDGTLKELSRASGNDCGGTSVDNNFINMMIAIFGRPLFDKFKSEFPDSYLNLIRRFESLKRTITPTRSGLVNILIPNIPLDNLCKSELHKSIQEVTSSTTLASKVNLYNDKLRIEASYAKSFFKNTIESIISLINDILSENRDADISSILLVGGFSESALVQDAIKQAFPDQIVVVPEEPSLAVLKGAVLFAYKPDSISSRITRYTYGVEIIREFDIFKDDCKRGIYKDGAMYCKNIFNSFMPSNKSIPVGMKVRQTYTTSKEFQSAHYLPVYFTDQDDVQFTDEGTSTKLGEIEVEIPNPTKHLRELNVVFCFGEAELTVMAVDKESGEQCRTKFRIQDFDEILL